MALNVWLLISIIVLIVIFVLKVVNKKQAIAVKLTLFLFVLLMVSLGYVYTTSDIQIKTAEDVFDFSSLYFSWVLSFFQEMKSITAHVINRYWG